MTLPLATVWQTLGDELSLSQGEADMLVAAALRLLAALVFGGVMGLEREHAGKVAGLRTHMLTALGAALFVLGPRLAGVDNAGVTRVIQGIVAGIGFLGAGVIIKQADEHHIKGVTTAAGIWLTAAIGICAGLGRLWLAALATAFALLVLVAAQRLERYVHRDQG